jgi:hypothetical protein
MERHNTSIKITLEGLQVRLVLRYEEKTFSSMRWLESMG